MNQDTLRRFGDILKIYSEQFELAFEEENIQDQLEYGITFMEDYPLRIKQVVDELLNYKVNKEVEHSETSTSNC